MKKIEATIKVDKTGAVSDALKGVVGGFTIVEGNGRGSGERQTMRAGRGTGTFVAEFNKVATVSTVVEDSKVDQVVNIIAGAAFSEKSGDGIVQVSDVEDIYNIASRQKGIDAL